MPETRYLHYDVFTARRFEGNQLAVFLDARGIDDRTMQAIAREMNFSESTFILPAERRDTDLRMRIFTPGSELPIAGHPTIGSTFALAHEGVISWPQKQFVFGLGVGPTPVELRWDGNRLTFASMDQLPPDIRPAAVAAEDVTSALGIDHDAFAATRLPIEEISCGVPYILVPLASRSDVDSVQPDPSALRRLRSGFGGTDSAVYVFSVERVGDDVTAYSRMFAPAFGIFEDPATGSACGPLGSYLVRHGLVPRDRADRIVAMQGVAMGRPSRIHIAILSDAHGAITRVQVGGEAVLVGEGRLSY
jgi:trans-2,3-dihydro-3-hydroxyanthranilate isomerase